MRCSFDLQPGWRSRLASPRNVVVPENEDGFSLALKDPESTKSELGRWYMAASLAGNTKTTSLMDWCVAAAVSASVDQLRGSDSLPEDLIDSLSRDCRIPPDALHR